jgi:hypothetical protein
MRSASNKARDVNTLSPALRTLGASLEVTVVGRKRWSGYAHGFVKGAAGIIKQAKPDTFTLSL